MTHDKAAELDRQAEAHRRESARLDRKIRRLREQVTELEEQAKGHLCRAIAAKEAAIALRRTP